MYAKCILIFSKKKTFVAHIYAFFVTKSFFFLQQNIMKLRVGKVVAVEAVLRGPVLVPQLHAIRLNQLLMKPLMPLVMMIYLLQVLPP